MALSDVPVETLLAICDLLSIRDLFALEVTCRFLREVVSSRCVWRTQLERLVNSGCACHIPLYVDVGQLNNLELRSLVVSTLRRIKVFSTSQGMGPFRGLGDMHNIICAVTTPNLSGLRQDSFCRLVPGCNLLVLAHMTFLKVFDVGTGACIWQHDTRANGEGIRLAGVAFEACSPTSCRILVACASRITNPLKFELFQLEQMDGKTEVSSISEWTTPRDVGSVTFDVLVCMGGEFATIAFQRIRPHPVIRSSLTIWNWRSNEIWTVEKDVHIRDLQIMRDHLFYTCEGASHDLSVDVVPLRKMQTPVRLDSIISSFRFNDESGTPMRPTPKLILQDLSRFGIADAVKVVMIIAMKHSLYAVHLEFWPGDECGACTSPQLLRHVQTFRKSIQQAIVKRVSLLVPSLSGLSTANRIQSGFENISLDTVAIRNVIGLNEDGLVYKAQYTGFPDRKSLFTVEFDYGGIIEFAWNGDTYRVYIYRFA